MNRKVKKTSTPLNKGRDIASLPFFKNISSVKNPRKKYNEMFETPSLLQFGIKPRKVGNYGQMPQGFTKSKSKPKCDTPARSKTSSRLFDKFSRQRLRFSSESNLSKKRKYGDSSETEFLLDGGVRKSISGSGRSKKRSSKNPNGRKTISQSIRNENMAYSGGPQMEKHNANRGIIEKQPASSSSKDNLMEEKADEDEERSSDEWKLNISDTPDAIESARSCSSAALWSVEFPPDGVILNDESFETIIEAADRDGSKSPISVASLKVDGTEIYEWDGVKKSKMEIVMSKGVGQGEKVIDDTKEIQECDEAKKTEKGIVISREVVESREVIDNIEIYEFDDANKTRIETDVISKEVVQRVLAIPNANRKEIRTDDNNSVKKSVEEDCPRHSHGIMEKQNRGLTIDPSETTFSENENGRAVDAKDACKKPLLVSEHGNVKPVIRKKSLMDNIRQTGALEALKDNNVCPSTLAPFGSPEISKQALPQLFEELSPISKYTKDELSTWPADDILITGIRAKRTYRKSKKTPVRSAKDLQRWSRFLKTETFSNLRNKENEVSEPMETSSFYLFDSPKPVKIPIDDIYVMRYNSLRKNNLLKK